MSLTAVSLRKGLLYFLGDNYGTDIVGVSIAVKRQKHNIVLCCVGNCYANGTFTFTSFVNIENLLVASGGITSVVRIFLENFNIKKSRAFIDCNGDVASAARIDTETTSKIANITCKGWA